MDTLFLSANPLALVAIDPAHNICRHYRIMVDRDLFCHVLVQANWGRIGVAYRRSSPAKA